MDKGQLPKAATKDRYWEKFLMQRCLSTGDVQEAVRGHIQDN